MRSDRLPPPLTLTRTRAPLSSPPIASIPLFPWHRIRAPRAPSRTLAHPSDATNQNYGRANSSLELLSTTCERKENSSNRLRHLNQQHEQRGKAAD